MEQILVAIVVGFEAIGIVAWWVIKITIIIAIVLVVLLFLWYIAAFLCVMILELWDSIVH